jgi:hypothetical protein
MLNKMLFVIVQKEELVVQDYYWLLVLKKYNLKTFSLKN